MGSISELNTKEKKILNSIVTLRNQKELPNYELTKNVLETLLYRDEKGNSLTNYICKEESSRNAFENNTNRFTLENNSINIITDNMLLWTETQCNSIIKHSEETTDEYYDLYYYLYFFVLLHEVSHSKQYLIAYKNFETKYEELRTIYKETCDSVQYKDTLIPLVELLRFIRLVLYKTKEQELIPDRNANVEGFESLIKIADHDRYITPTAKELLNYFYTTTLLSGYKKNYKGNITSPSEITMGRLLKKHKLKKIEFTKDISLIECLSHGLPINTSQFIEMKKLEKKHLNNSQLLKKKIYQMG